MTVTEKEIEKFLAKYRLKSDIWTSGSCYWMSIILRERFGGTIYYNPVENHFVCMIGLNYYDAEGIYFTNDFLFDWERYKEFEPLDSARVERDCIL